MSSDTTLDNDPINHPSHYRRGKIEAIEVIEDWGLGYHLGNALKYLCRAGLKDPLRRTEDLKKAVWYLQREIGRQENATTAQGIQQSPGNPLRDRDALRESGEASRGAVLHDPFGI